MIDRDLVVEVLVIANQEWVQSRETRGPMECEGEGSVQASSRLVQQADRSRSNQRPTVNHMTIHVGSVPYMNSCNSLLLINCV